jgi:hypothetical protein
MGNTTPETLVILTKADRDRIDAAVGLLGQVIEELISAREVCVPLAVHSPTALCERAEECDKIHEEQLSFVTI